MASAMPKIHSARTQRTLILPKKVNTLNPMSQSPLWVSKPLEPQPSVGHQALCGAPRPWKPKPSVGQPFAWSKGPPLDLEDLFGQNWASDFLPSKGGNEGLALNPKRWKIGWLASYLERGGKKGISPRSKGPSPEKHTNTIP